MGIMLDLFQRNRYYVETPYNNFFELKAKDINKNIVPFSTYNHKVILVFNFCPAADNMSLKSQFEKLNELKTSINNPRFEVFAFPSCQTIDSNINLSDNESRELILKKNDIIDINNLRMFNRVYLNSSEMADVYKFCLKNSSLFDKTKGTAEGVRDYTKFLISKNGKVYEHYTRDIPNDELEDNIRNLLNERESNIDLRTDYINYNKYY
jgi:glutathione peroxidase-family protein